ncbi:MAG: hypothetical protein LBI29_04420 [Rickettsiales bacterium]|jgi:hypothetical protein|nr:hypothetical protein [Rickettsiales bacterium]
MFVEFDGAGNIVATAEFKFSDASIETSSEVVRGNDGKLYFSGNEPEDDEVAKLKRDIILEKQGELEKTFYINYPLHKQCNLGVFGTEEEREAFKEFHHANISEFDSFISSVEECSTREELEIYRNGLES